MTFMSLKPKASVFRLKRNQHNLANENYSQNLISDFCSARCCKQITISDLCNVMRGIMGRSEAVPTNINEISSSSMRAICQQESEIIQGEHVIVFWVEESKIKWYLGIVKTNKNDKLVISYMSKADKKGKVWTFPECAELSETSQEQIRATKDKVQYLGSVRICCHIISDSLIEETNAIVATKQ